MSDIIPFSMEEKQMLKIMGQAQAAIDQLRNYIEKVNPTVAESVIKMIPLYFTEGAIE